MALHWATSSRTGRARETQSRVETRDQRECYPGTKACDGFHERKGTLGGEILCSRPLDNIHTLHAASRVLFLDSRSPKNTGPGGPRQSRFSGDSGAAIGGLVGSRGASGTANINGPLSLGWAGVIYLHRRSKLPQGEAAEPGGDNSLSVTALCHGAGKYQSGLD